MSKSIDVSTHQLAEQVHKALGGKVKLEDVLAVWHSIGATVKAQLISRKGTKLSSLGTFTMSLQQTPVFIMSRELSKKFNVKQKAQPVCDNLPTPSLNLTQAASGMGSKIPRDVIEKIYTKYIVCIGKAILENRTVHITIHRVCEVSIADRVLECSFMPDFLEALNVPAAGGSSNKLSYENVLNNTAGQLKKDKAYMAEINKTTPRDDFAFGREEPAPRPSKGAAGRSTDRVAREPNPITGGGYNDESQRRAKSANRAGVRPSSAGADGRPGTPGRYGAARPGSADGARRRVAGGRAGDGVPNARNIAAQALDTGGIVERVRQKVLERGGVNGIKSLARLMAIMDDNGDKRLSKSELEYGMRDYGVELSKTEIEQVFLYFDRDRNGFIDFNEFLVGIRGPLNAARKKLVRMAFNILDSDRSGVITVEEVLAKYDLTWHPEVRSGTKTVKEAAKDFMLQWDRQEQDGLITYEEFEDYYKDVSSSIDDDTYFELMIRNAWRIAGGTGMAANTANRRVLVTDKNGNQVVQTIEDELGMDASNMDDVKARLARQGVSGDVEMYGGFDNTDKPKKDRRERPGAPRIGQRGGGGGGGGGGGRSRPQPREAWGGADDDMFAAGPRRGDEGAAPPSPDRRKGGDRGDREDGGRRGESKPQKGGVTTPWDVLAKTLYTPPISMEALCSKLQVSSVTTNPRIAQGAFAQRMSTIDPKLGRDVVKAVWACVDPRGKGAVEIGTIYTALTDRYGKDKSSASKGVSIIDRVVKKILERCGGQPGIKGLQRTLSIMDDNGDKKLDKTELKTGLRDYGIELTLQELDAVFSYFDRDHNGVLDVTEFLVGVRGELSDRRKKFVRMAFNILDTDRSGVVTVDEMMAVYDVSTVPEVQSGKITQKQAMRNFMNNWDSNSDGLIAYEEFEDYYKGISASIDGDDYFELMIRNAWRIAGGTGMAANTANRRVLVTDKNGNQVVQTIEDELGMDASNMDDVKARLARQGVSGDVEMYGGFDNTDKPKKDRGERQRRTEAASKVAAAFRGKQGRSKAQHEQRKADAYNRERQEEEYERTRPKARPPSRPKGKSYIGF